MDLNGSGHCIIDQQTCDMQEMAELMRPPLRALLD
jgi:hypothetical protein